MNRRILVVDDSASLRSILKVFLSGMPLDIVEASDVARALTLVRIQKPDMVLADFNMPGRTGVELFREIRSAAGGNRIALVLLSAQLDPALEAEARAAGADECLLKPIDPAKLKLAIEKAFAARTLALGAAVAKTAAS